MYLDLVSRYIHISDKFYATKGVVVTVVGTGDSYQVQSSKSKACQNCS
jgi:hypothetical protein